MLASFGVTLHNCITNSTTFQTTGEMDMVEETVEEDTVAPHPEEGTNLRSNHTITNLMNPKFGVPMLPNNTFPTVVNGGQRVNYVP